MNKRSLSEFDFRHLFREKLDPNDVLQSNELEANRLVSFTLIVSSMLVLLVWAINHTGLFHLEADSMDDLTLQALFGLLLPAFICNFFKAERRWIKYLLLIELVIALARADCLLGYNVSLAMAIPVVLSTRYFSKWFTNFIAVLTSVLFAFSTFACAYWDGGLLDLNFYRVPEGTTLTVNSTLREAVRALGIDKMDRMQGLLFMYYLPKLLIFIVIAIVCFRIADYGRTMVLEQEKIAQENARIEADLLLANDIQTHMLPTIFPPIPDREEIELYALMNPAKAVGGDFYDFFNVDDDKMALVMADVSGKGVPAALVMVITKTLIKNEVNMGASPSEAFSKVSHMLCEGNEDGMFVTAWLGILDTSTGVLEYSNAGHNPPLIKLGNGSFDYLRSKPGMVLAGMDGYHYEDYQVLLSPGDQIFLYTDGVTEAINEKEEFYGSERLKDYLNSHFCDDVKSTVHALRKDISKFAGEAEQFDDITMLLLNYSMKRKKDDILERKFIAKDTNLDEVMSFVEEKLVDECCSPKVLAQIGLCVEEIFVNIAKYAYQEREDSVTVGVKLEGDSLIVRFADHGIPYDPLSKKDPDITLSAADRPVGGLGVYLVKQTMDDVKYEFKNGRNVLTMKKRLSGHNTVSSEADSNDNSSTNIESNHTKGLNE